jgi:GH24 family phage-related lysozyme (muramidase)
MTQCRFDAMTSFAFNIGAGAYKSSSMYRFHTLGGPFGEPISPSLLVYASKQGLDPHNVAEGFAAYSRASHVWTRGLFRRRLAEALVYSGRDVGEAVRFAQTYNC